MKISLENLCVDLGASRVKGYGEVELLTAYLTFKVFR